MKKYRKRPIVVEAVQFFPTMEDLPECIEEYIRETRHYAGGEMETVFAWRVNTPEGPMAVRPGDFIIKGIAGEYYPCKPDIFEATYEPADD